ncbi:hypothetical protein BC834DRAFT_969259 [Gloeopeniophorella convolvens]|nr:hypothetical protein BC834DRAFT_969259 [Gloeopeniophorella convolvens]
MLAGVLSQLVCVRYHQLLLPPVVMQSQLYHHIFHSVPPRPAVEAAIPAVSRHASASVPAPLTLLFIFVAIALYMRTRSLTRCLTDSRARAIADGEYHAARMTSAEARLARSEERVTQCKGAVDFYLPYGVKLEESILEHRERIRELEGHLAEFNNRIDFLERCFSEEQDGNDHLQALLLLAQTEKEARDEYAKSLETDLDNHARRLTEAVCVVHVLNAHYDGLSQQNADFLRQAWIADEDRRNSRLERAKLHLSLNNLQAKVDKLVQRDIEHTEREAAHAEREALLQSKIENQDDLLIEILLECDGYKEQGAHLQAIFSAREDTVTVLQDQLQAREADFSASRAQMAAEGALLTSRIGTLEADLSSAHRDIQNCQAGLTKVNFRVVALETESAKLVAAHADASAQVISLRSQIISLQDEIPARSERLCAQEADLVIVYAANASLAVSEAMAQSEILVVRGVIREQASQLTLQRTAIGGFEAEKDALEREFNEYREEPKKLTASARDQHSTFEAIKVERQGKLDVLRGRMKRVREPEASHESEFLAAVDLSGPLTPPDTPEGVHNDFSSPLACSSIPTPAPTPSDTPITDRQRSFLRAGVLVREALRACNAPVPDVDVEEFATELPSSVAECALFCFGEADETQLLVPNPTEIPLPSVKPVSHRASRFPSRIPMLSPTRRCFSA